MVFLGNFGFLGVLLVTLLSNELQLSSAFESLNKVQQLPKSIQPLEYRLHFSPDGNTAGVVGRVEIKVRTVKRKRKNLTGNLAFLAPIFTQKGPKRLFIHASDNLYIRSIEYIQGEEHKKDTEYVEVVDWKHQGKEHLLRIDLEKRLKMGSTGTLKIEFQNKFIDSRSTISGGNSNHRIWMAALRPMGARSLFPCFDEPEYRATFELVVSGFGVQNVDIITNSDELPQSGPFNKHAFQKTPLISPHLFTLIISDFTTKWGVTNSGVRVQVHMERNRLGRADFALATAIKAIEWMEQNTGKAYRSSKLDIIAQPMQIEPIVVMASVISVEEYLLLIDEDGYDKEKVNSALSVFFGVAAQWFGVELSVRHWHEHWILDGLAALKAYQMISELYPEFESDFFLMNGLQFDLKKRFPFPSYPLSWPEWTEWTERDFKRQVAHVDFTKAASMMSMISLHLYDHIFEKRIKRLFNLPGKQNSLISTAEFFQNLEDTHLYEQLKIWLYSSHFPQVFVRLSTNDNFVVSLSSMHAISDFEELKKNYTTYMKLRVVFSDGADNNEIFNMDVLSSSHNFRFPYWFSLTDWSYYLKLRPKPNKPAPYCISYDDRLSRSLGYAIKTKALNAKERLSVLDNCPISYKSLLKWYVDEEDLGVLNRLVNIAVDHGDDWYGTEDECGLLDGTFHKAYKKHGFMITGHESAIELEARRNIYAYLIHEDFKSVINVALEAFERNDKIAMKFMREPIYKAVVKAGTKEQKDQLLSRLKPGQVMPELERIGLALAQSEDEELLVGLLGAAESFNISEKEYRDWLKKLVLKMSESEVGQMVVQVVMSEWPELNSIMMEVGGSIRYDFGC